MKCCGAPAFLTLSHSLTGPAGQLLASCLRGQLFASRGCTNSQWNRVFLLALSRYSGDRDSGCTSCTVHFTVSYTCLGCTQCQSLSLSPTFHVIAYLAVCTPSTTVVTLMWSLITGMVDPLTFATGCFSRPSCPSSILTAGHRLMRHTARIL